MKDKDPAAKSPPPPKEPYKSPHLTEQGNVRDLTQGGPSAGADNPSKQKPPAT